MHLIRTASLGPLKGKTIAVIGYGSQGRAQALNLRDHGHAPIVALRTRSRNRRQVLKDGLRIETIPNAVSRADVVFVLIPDHLHGKVFDVEIRPYLQPRQMLVFAHGSSIHFGFVRPPKSVDVMLAAPLGPGKRLRELNGKRDGVACFFAIHQDASGRARALGLALCKAIGCLPAGAIETTFAEEAVGDLFGEQAVLCGGLAELLQAGVDTLVHHGLKPESAYLECVYQIDLIIDLIKSEGLEGMFRRISPTAAYGARFAGPKIINAGSRRAMDEILRHIVSGQFMKTWISRAGRSRTQIQPVVSTVYRKAESKVRRLVSS